jgi:hypothetical protein
MRGAGCSGGVLDKWRVSWSPKKKEWHFGQVRPRRQEKMKRDILAGEREKKSSRAGPRRSMGLGEEITK